MIKGLLCDLHGVLYTYPDAIAGSVDAVQRLVDQEFPHLFLTNTSLHNKSWILQSLEDLGFEVTPERLLTVAEAAGQFLGDSGHHRVGWLCVEALKEDLPGLETVSPDQPDPGPVDAVLVGDLGSGFTPSTLNQAFQWLADGADLVALARNRCYQGPEGLVLDGGPYVALLEFAAETEAKVVGKPNPAFFEAGLQRLGFDAGEVAMVGDDFQGDVLPAMQLGIHGIQVETGKYRRESYERESRRADRLESNLRSAVHHLLDSAAGTR